MKLTIAVLLCTAMLASADDSSSWYGRYTGLSRDGGDPPNLPRSYFNLPKLDGNYRFRWRGSNRPSGNGGNGGYGNGGGQDWMSKLKDLMGDSGSNGGYVNGNGNSNGDWMSEIMQMFMGKKGGDGNSGYSNGAGDWMSKVMKSFMENKGNNGGYGDSGGDWMSKIMKMFMGNKDSGGYGSGGSNGGYGGGDWVSKMMKSFMSMGNKDSAGYGGGGSNGGYGGGDWMSKMMKSFKGNKGAHPYDGNALYEGVGLMSPGAVDLTRWGMRTLPKISGDYAYTWKGDNINSRGEDGSLPALLWKYIAKNLIQYDWGDFGPGPNKYDLPGPMYWTMDTVGQNPYKWTSKNPSGGITDWFQNSFVPSSMAGDWKWRGDYDTEAFDMTGLSEDEAWAKWFTDMWLPRTMDGDWDWTESRRGPSGYGDSKGMMQKMFKYLMEKKGGY